MGASASLVDVPPLDPLRGSLIHTGRWLPGGFARKLQNVTGYLEVGRWLRENNFGPGHGAKVREDLWEQIGQSVRDQNVLYLEFGVAAGAATRYWSRLLRNPASNLHGFDSFEGLPEKWGTMPKGTFSQDGKIPQVDDPRVKFFKGRFQDTLPQYEPPVHDVLVLNLDADLYSSTALILGVLHPWIKPGTYVYLDEFSSPQHEFRAFSEFVARTGAGFSLLGSTPLYRQVAFQRLA